ncbi:MAG: hypothetical protein J5855_05615 [Mailhella sp.]|nr:hypothetical protein [Mailhella sp.]
MTRLFKMLLLAAAVIITVSVSVASAAATGNLLVNGDASQGFRGWTTVDTYWKTAPSYESVSAHNGHFFYPQGFKGNDGASTRIWQDVDIRKYAGKPLTLSAYVRTWDTVNTDETVLLLEFFDAGGRLLGKGSVTSSKDPKWHRISVTRTAPSGTVLARVSLLAVYHYGSEVDSYFDDVVLTGGSPSASSGTPPKPLPVAEEKPGNPLTATGNLLVNGDASQGLRGWTTADAYWKTAIVSPHDIKAYNGNLFYPYEFKGKDGASTRIWQDVDIRKYAGKPLTLSAYVRTWDTVNTDETVLLLEFFDAGGRLLDKGSVTSSKDPKWHRISVTRAAPSGTVRARVSLVAVYHYGSAVDSYFDDVSLTAGGSPSASSSGTPSKPSGTSSGTPPKPVPDATEKPGKPQVATGNLLVNGDASQGLRGWTTADAYWKTTSSYGPSTGGDAHYFCPRGVKGKDGASTRIWQDVDIKGYAGKMALTASVGVFTSDPAHACKSTLLLELFDARGKLLDKGSASFSQYSGTGQTLGVNRTVPSNAVIARFSLSATCNAGHQADICFSGASLIKSPAVNSTPPPSSSGTPPVPSSSPNVPAGGETMAIVYLDTGDKLRIGALAGGKEASEASFSSSASRVAEVSSRGMIRALSEGSATVTVRSGGTILKIRVIVRD